MPNKNKIEFLLVLFLVKVIHLIGLKGARVFGKILASFFYYFIPIRKSVAIKNIREAFPNLSSGEIKKIVQGSYQSFIITFIELLSLPKISREKLHSLVKCNQLSLLREKYSLGKGVIFLTGHFGNWEVGAASVASQLGISMQVLAKNQRNPLVDELINKHREFYGNKVIKLGASIRDVYKSIKEGKIVGVVGDQRGPFEGIRVQLFNKDTAIYSGTALIALKTNVPLITVFVKRLDDGSYNAIVEEIPLQNLPETESEKIAELNQRYMNILERRIREAPEQWFWQHKIWKY
jgi:KDO2-lipid IV(A) lauroyltransferase